MATNHEVGSSIPSSALFNLLKCTAANARECSVMVSHSPHVKVSSPAQKLLWSSPLRRRVNNKLGMARDMHVQSSDEVARNGAFGKILRPEVFPGAPLPK